MTFLLHAGMLMALAAGGPRALPFTNELPAEVPPLTRWQKASGSSPLDGGATFMQYELYYDPGRSDYEVIRYRLTGWSGDAAGPYTEHERLQWQAALKNLRRYVCEPQSAGGCRWRELDKKDAEYARELPVLMWVLNLHRRLLYEREGAFEKK
jgi:hypothetical protein